MIRPPAVRAVAHIPPPAPVPDAEHAIALAVAVRRSRATWRRYDSLAEAATVRPGGVR